MRKKPIILGLMIIALCLFGVSAYVSRDLFLEFPLSPDFLSLRGLTYGTTDSSNNVYGIIDSGKRIICLDSTGLQTREIKLRDSEVAGNWVFAALVPDGQGNLLVLLQQNDTDRIHVYAQKVVRYNLAGDVDKVFYSHKNTGAERVAASGIIKSFWQADDSVRFHVVRNNKIELKTINSAGELQSQVLASIPGDVYLSDIAGTEMGRLYYSTYQGKIYLLDDDENPVEVFPRGNKKMSSVFPTNLIYGQMDKLIFVDANNGRVMSLNPENHKADTIFASLQALRQGARLDSFNVINASKVGSNGLVLTTEHEIVLANIDGQITRIASDIDLPLTRLLVIFLYWLQIPLFIVLLIIISLIIWNRSENSKASSAIKQTMILTPIVFLMMGMLSFMVYRDNLQSQVDEILQRLIWMAEQANSAAMAPSIESISRTDQFMNEDYRQLHDLIGAARGDSGGGMPASHSALYKVVDNRIFMLVDYENRINMFRPMETSEELRQALDEGKMVSGYRQTANGNRFYAVKPIRDVQGKEVGALEVWCLETGGFNKQVPAMAGTAFGASLLIIFLFFVVTYVFRDKDAEQEENEIPSLPLKEKKPELVVHIKREVDLPPAPKPEEMTETTRNHLTRLSNISQASMQFVPQQMIELIGRKTVEEVQLGDQVSGEAGIIFVRINSFFKHTAKLPPDKLMGVINAFARRAGNIVRKNGGLVDIYAGSGLRALFPSNAEESLQAAVELRSDMSAFAGELQRIGMKPIEITVGVHWGPMRLAILGEDDYLTSAVISENATLALELARISEILGVSVLATEDVFRAVNDIDSYHHRSLGVIRIPGRSELLHIFDVFEGDDEAVRQAKMDTRDMFESGVYLYQKGSFIDARASFIDVIKRNRQDRTAKIYFDLCDRYGKVGMPAEWDGTIVI
ncbi:MAG: adenylate/guanylate cyclase domain-containing protein [Acidobacteriota bacterium]